MPTILHVLDHSVPMHSGYTFRTLSILRHQHKLGWRTAHVTSWKHSAPSEAEEVVEGLRFHRTLVSATAGPRLPVLRELALMRALARRLDEVVTRERPDILHAHSPVLNALPALWVGRKHGLPVVYEVRAFWEDAAASHGSYSADGPFYAAVRWLETQAMKRADAVTTICEGLRGDILARGIPAEKVTVIPNAVDEAMFTPQAGRDPALARQMGLEGCFVLGFLGSFYGYEGLHLLIAALPALAQMVPNVRVLLVGGGPEEDALKGLAARLDVADRVVFAGRVPHGRVAEYYSLVDLLVFPRVNIRLTDLVTPLKPLEAMAQGHLVAASDVGGHRELIRDGETGFLFAADDSAALADAVVRVARLPAQDAERLRANGRRFVETERTWAASVSRYQAVYGAVVERARRA